MDVFDFAPPDRSIDRCRHPTAHPALVRPPQSDDLIENFLRWMEETARKG